MLQTNMTAPTLPETVDLVVVGAGTAGAATAAFAAEKGLRVLCIDRRPLGNAGARWVNGVTRASLTEAGLDPDAVSEFGPPPRFHLIGTRRRVVVERHDVVDVDMRKLVATLHARALVAGATLVGGVAVRGRHGGTLFTDHGTVRARWIVDASGFKGARLLEQERIGAEHLCAAAQGVYEVKDRAGAASYFEQHGVPPDEICAFLGRAGGYSVLNMRMLGGGDTIGVLAGSIPHTGAPSGKTVLDGWLASQPWVGPRVYGGQGAIPVRRPRDRLTDGTVALVGDAGCQVFPAHGSGIGAGLLAAKLLADTLATTGSLFDYEHAWHRRWGGLFATYDAVRRWNQAIDPAVIDDIMERGMFDVEMARAGLDQQLPRVSAIGIRTKLRGLVSQPGWARGLADLAARSVAVQALYARFPRNPIARAAWTAAVQHVLPV